MSKADRRFLYAVTPISAIGAAILGFVLLFL